MYCVLCTWLFALSLIPSVVANNFRILYITPGPFGHISPKWTTIMKRNKIILVFLLFVFLFMYKYHNFTTEEEVSSISPSGSG